MRRVEETGRGPCYIRLHFVLKPSLLQCPSVTPFPPLKPRCLDYPPAPTPLRRPWRRNGSRKRRRRRRLGVLNNSTLNGGMLDGSREVHCSVQTTVFIYFICNAPH